MGKFTRGQWVEIQGHHPKLDGKTARIRNAVTIQKEQYWCVEIQQNDTDKFEKFHVPERCLRNIVQPGKQSA